MELAFILCLLFWVLGVAVTSTLLIQDAFISSEDYPVRHFVVAFFWPIAVLVVIVVTFIAFVVHPIWNKYFK